MTASCTGEESRNLCAREAGDNKVRDKEAVDNEDNEAVARMWKLVMMRNLMKPGMIGR